MGTHVYESFLCAEVMTLKCATSMTSFFSILFSVQTSYELIKFLIFKIEIIVYTVAREIHNRIYEIYL